ncbi:hypothetical protein WN55_01771 [Dufourea novaeangliae]|uniref:Uncharacterized protein n=1 Tax=Dufourea novaeangliae TaxID=178035 RepID=A0A154NY87_DUFNO|nr:hypothetical protein WN55_01771 [Dufourea novaeangliae]
MIISNELGLGCAIYTAYARMKCTRNLSVTKIFCKYLGNSGRTVVTCARKVLHNDDLDNIFQGH